MRFGITRKNRDNFMLKMKLTNLSIHSERYLKYLLLTFIQNQNVIILYQCNILILLMNSHETFKLISYNKIFNIKEMNYN